MSIKIKALSLGLFAMLAMGAFAAVNVGAKVDGHFVFGSEHAFVTGSVQKGTAHNLHFIAEDGSLMGCDVQQYIGTHKSIVKTTTEITVTPNWDQCYTTPEGTKFPVDENGCDLRFTARALPESNDATAHVACPLGKTIVFTHPNCETTVDPQTVGGAAGNGFTYTNKDVGVAGVSDWITMDVKVKVLTAYHGGICVFLGTNHTGTLEGSVTVTGFSNAAHTIRTNITAT